MRKQFLEQAQKTTPGGGARPKDAQAVFGTGAKGAVSGEVGWVAEPSGQKTSAAGG
jgi:hypothetical protein